MRRFRKNRVVVHTKDDRDIRGVLAARHRDCLVIANPVYLNEAQETPLGGDAVVPIANLSWLQVL